MDELMLGESPAPAEAGSESAGSEPVQAPGAAENVQYDGLTGEVRGGIERESFETTRADTANVRALRDAKRICVRCTFCGRCKKGSKRRTVNVRKLDSL